LRSLPWDRDASPAWGSPSARKPPAPHSYLRKNTWKGRGPSGLCSGVWTATRTSADPVTRASERKRLIARREKLLADLVRLERDQRDDRRYLSRREEIVAALEQVYDALDSDGITPGPGNTAGVAA